MSRLAWNVTGVEPTWSRITGDRRLLRAVRRVQDELQGRREHTGRIGRVWKELLERAPTCPEVRS